MLIGMEAYGGAHFLSGALQTQGHDARLMPAQFVKAFRKSNKNDYLDAEAIAEAVQRPTMRFVPIKTDDQLDLQALHRVRDRWVARRTAVMNQIRGFLMERGITIRKGPSHLTTQLQGILEDADSLLSGRLRLLILELKHEWDELDKRIENSNAELQRIAEQDDACHRHGDSRLRPAGIDRIGGCNRQRYHPPKRQRSVCMARSRSPSTLDWRQDQTARHQQARKRISTTHVPAWGSICSGTDWAKPFLSWSVAFRSIGAKPSQCDGCSAGEQDGSNRLGHFK
jgi:hypothetical protein